MINGKKGAGICDECIFICMRIILEQGKNIKIAFNNEGDYKND